MPRVLRRKPKRKADRRAAYLVKVKLEILAAHLAARYGGDGWDERQAARWLTQPGRAAGLAGDPSPFRQTDQPGVYYSAEDPAAWLGADEILYVRPARAIDCRCVICKVADLAA